MQKYSMDDFRDTILAAMNERGIGQAELARQSGLSQGHLSKVLRTMEMGRRTRDRLQKWLDHADQADLVDTVGPDDLLQIGAMLKRHCDELARLSRRLRAGAAQPAAKSS
jgi:transcriptional regulator with XRE-family HTH domain